MCSPLMVRSGSSCQETVSSQHSPHASPIIQKCRSVRKCLSNRTPMKRTHPNLVEGSCAHGTGWPSSIVHKHSVFCLRLSAVCWDVIFKKSYCLYILESQTLIFWGSELVWLWLKYKQEGILCGPRCWLPSCWAAALRAPCVCTRPGDSSSAHMDANQMD